MNNNKLNRVAGCESKPRLLWHRMPRAEGRRMRMLHAAAVAGTCHGNVGLQSYQR